MGRSRWCRSRCTQRCRSRCAGSGKNMVQVCRSRYYSSTRVLPYYSFEQEVQDAGATSEAVQQEVVKEQMQG
jgi:hypothetical protein